VIILGVLLSGIVIGHCAIPSSALPAPPGDRAGPAPRRWEATVYLPLSDNRGRTFPDTVWQEALEALVSPFGGATLGPPQEGCWVNARGQVCREWVRPIVISFAPDHLTTFRNTVRDVGTRLGQEAMYVRFEEPRVDLIPIAPARRPEVSRER
jgi:hypothetical protein